MASKESGSITRNIPTLTGPNYAHWSYAMTGYFWMTGLWKIVNGDIVRPAGAGVTQDQIDAWEEKDERANGSITMFIDQTLMHLIKTTSKQSWDDIKTLYGTPGAAGLFVDFKAATHFMISDKDDVTNKYTKLDAIFAHLTKGGLTLPNNVQAMIMLSALPDSFDGIASTLLAMLTTATLTPSEVLPKIHEEVAHQKGPTSSLAARLSTVKCAPTASGSQICCEKC